MPWFSKSIYFLKTFASQVFLNTLEVLKEIQWVRPLRPIRSTRERTFPGDQRKRHSVAPSYLFSIISLQIASPNLSKYKQVHSPTHLPLNVIMWLSFSQWDVHRNCLSNLHQEGHVMSWPVWLNWLSVSPGHWFDSPLGHMPKLWVPSPVDMHMGSNRLLVFSHILTPMFLFPSPSLCQKKKKINEKTFFFLKKGMLPPFFSLFLDERQY